MSITKNKLKKLRESLPVGSAGLIAKKRNISAEYVRRVLRGDADSLEIIADALEIAAEEKSKTVQLERKIKSL